MRARFGTAGNPEGFYAAGKKQSKQMPGWLRERGLDAYEYQCGKGVTVGEATARAIGQAAAQAGIALSLHAPYFVNPANPEPDSQAKTAGYVLAACRVARWMGADLGWWSIPGRSRNGPARRPWPPRRQCFRTLRHRCDEEGYQDILLCPETMGKINQLGDLEEVLTLCTERRACCPAWTLATCMPAPWGRWTARRRWSVCWTRWSGNWGWPGPASFTAIFPRLPIRPGGERPGT